MKVTVDTFPRFQVEIRPASGERIVIYEDNSESDRLFERAIDAHDYSGCDVAIVSVMSERNADGSRRDVRETRYTQRTRNGRTVME